MRRFVSRRKRILKNIILIKNYLFFLFNIYFSFIAFRKFSEANNFYLNIYFSYSHDNLNVYSYRSITEKIKNNV